MKITLPFMKPVDAVGVESGISLSITVSENYTYLEGHFPDYPLVPAIAQVGWLVSIVGSVLGHPLRRYRLNRLKFTHPIRPGDEVSIVVRSSKNKYSMRVAVGDTLCCSGTLILEEDV